MGADLRPYISDDYPNAGQSLGNADPDWAYDCQLECLKITARDYGQGTPYNDQQLRNLGEPTTGSSGMLFPTILNDVAAKAYPALHAAMAIQTPANLPAQLRANLALGYMQHVTFWCDTNAWVPPQGATAYSHCCRCVADTGTGFVFQNPEPHPDFTLTDAQVTSLSDGEGLLVFQRSLLPTAASVGGGGLAEFVYRPGSGNSLEDAMGRTFIPSTEPVCPTPAGMAPR